MNPTDDLFIERVHHLLQAGYETFTAKDLRFLQGKHEPDISGELALRIQQLIDSRKVIGITRAWSVVDNPPENEPEISLTKRRLGKHRKLPDLKLRFGGARETRYFRFEAKSLADSGAYADLISHNDGLGRFLRKVYGRSDRAGGLLGYVKSETNEAHSSRIENAFSNDARKYSITPSGKWEVVKWKNGPECCFRTEHSRGPSGAEIVIYHSFLVFR